MYCVVLCKLDGEYNLRHIIYGIKENEPLESVKEKYYKDFYKMDDEFFFCKDNSEIKKVLNAHGIKYWSVGSFQKNVWGKI